MLCQFCYYPEGLCITLEAVASPVVFRKIVQNLFSDVAVRRVAKVMGQAGRFYYFRVDLKRLRDFFLFGITEEFFS